MNDFVKHAFPVDLLDDLDSDKALEDAIKGRESGQGNPSGCPRLHEHGDGSRARRRGGSTPSCRTRSAVMRRRSPCGSMRDAWTSRGRGGTSKNRRRRQQSRRHRQRPLRRGPMRKREDIHVFADSVHHRWTVA